MRLRALTTIIFMAYVATLTAGCASIRGGAVDVVADALTSGGGGVYNSDSDPELIEEALPFGLKTFESLLAASPNHRGLLLASANGFAAYAYLIEQRADRVDATDLETARHLRARASSLFLRGRDYALRGLETSHANFTAMLRRDPASALAATSKNDAPFLYWAGAAWAGALSAQKDNPELIADLPTAGMLVNRVLELDDGYDKGAAHEFFISYEGSRPGGSAAKAREHFERALQLSQGQRASVYIALAESVDLPAQNLGEFRSMLDKASSVDPDRAPESRLINTIARERAEWLRTRIPDLFADATEMETP